MVPQRRFLHSRLQAHVAETNSAWGREILEDFSAYVGRFWLVKPKAAEFDSLLDTLHSNAA